MAWEYAVMSSIVVGLAGGAFVGYLAARTIWRMLSGKLAYPRIFAAFIASGLVIACPIALFLSFVVGGNLGGGSGAFISESVNLGSAGVPLGLVVGIAAVLGVGLTVGAALGGAVGYAVVATKEKLAA